MNRKRALAIVAGVVGLAVVAGVVAVSVLYWPVITGEQIVVGPTVAGPSWEATMPPMPETMPTLAVEAPPRPAVPDADEPGQDVAATAGMSDALMLHGGWYCYQGSSRFPQGCVLEFRAWETEYTGYLYLRNPGEEEWLEAWWELGAAGYLVISALEYDILYFPLSSEYAIQFGVDQGYDVMWIWSLAEAEKNDPPAKMWKIGQAVDPYWEEFHPEPADPAVSKEPTAEQLELAREITASHYPLLAVQSLLVNPDQPSIGDALFAATRLSGSPEVIAAMTHYAESDEVPEPTWLEAGNRPTAYRVDTTADGTRYMWDSELLAPLQGGSIDPTITSLLQQVVSDHPGCVVAGIALGDDVALGITRWEAYPIAAENGLYVVRYGRTPDGWAFEGAWPPE